MGSPAGDGHPGNDNDVRPMEVDDAFAGSPYVIVYLDGRREGFDGDREQLLDMLGSYTMDEDGRTVIQTEGMPARP